MRMIVMSTGRLWQALRHLDEADEELATNVPDPEAVDPTRPMTPVQRARWKILQATQELRHVLGCGPSEVEEETRATPSIPTEVHPVRNSTEKVRVTSTDLPGHERVDGSLFRPGRS